MVSFGPRVKPRSKIMGWIRLPQGKIIGPFWFRDENGRPITVNLVVYLNMLRNQVCPLVEHRRDIRRLWFQQDGATCHTTPPVLQFLQTAFGDRIISRHSKFLGPLTWTTGSVVMVVLQFIAKTSGPLPNCSQALKISVVESHRIRFQPLHPQFTSERSNVNKMAGNFFNIS